MCLTVGGRGLATLPLGKNLLRERVDERLRQPFGAHDGVLQAPLCRVCDRVRAVGRDGLGKPSLL
jgi:hypothetical protein